MDRRKIDVAMTALLIVASLIILTNDNLAQGGVQTDLGSMFLPRLVAIVLIAVSATIGATAIMSLSRNAPLQEELIRTDGFFGVGIYITTFIVYWLAVPYVGFLIATPFAMFGIAFLLGGRQWLPIIAMSIITPVVVFYLCREYLRVFLPTWSF